MNLLLLSIIIIIMYKLFIVTLDKITWIKCLCNPAAKIKMDQHILKEISTGLKELQYCTENGDLNK